MIKSKRSVLIFVSCFLAICLIIASVFIITKTLSQKPKQDDNFPIPNNILKLVNSNEEDIIWSEEPNEIIVNNNDGTYSKHIFASPVKYVNSNNEEAYIDTSMVKCEDSNYKYQNSAGFVTSKFGNMADDGVSVTSSDINFNFVPVLQSNAKAKMLVSEDNDDTVYYSNVFGEHTEVRYNNTYTGVKEDIILKKNIDKNCFEYELDTNGDIPVLSECKSIIQVRDAKTQEVKYTFQEVFAYDSYVLGSGNDSVKHYTEDCYYELEKLEDSKYKITIVVSEEFLNSSNTVYPVIIDPTVSCSTAVKNIADTYTSQTNSTSNYYQSARLRVGNYNGNNHTSGKNYTYVNYYTLPTIPTGSTITSAKLKLTLRPGATTSSACKAYQVTSAWTSSSVTWKTNPSISTASDAVNPVNMSTFTFEVKSIVQKWYNGTANAYGFRVAYANESHPDGNSFCSAEYGTASYSPSLSITYTVPVVYDLSINSVSSPQNNGQYYLNDSISISAVIKNNTTSAVSNVPVNFALINTDTNATVNSWSRTVQTISANSTATVTLDNWTAQPGNYRLEVSVNSNQSILENNTSNNILSSSFHVNSNIYQSYNWVSPTSSTIVSIPYSADHLGTRIQCTYGDAVVGVDNATVLSTGYNEYMGYYVIMQTSTIDANTQKNYIVRYTNLQSISVSEGNTVSKGDTIGTVGVTGYVNTPSLYIDVNNGGVTQTQQLTEQNTIDPCNFW